MVVCVRSPEALLIAITCPSCTNLNPSSARECSRCGAEVDATAERGLDVGDRIDRRYRLESWSCSHEHLTEWVAKAYSTDKWRYQS